MKKKALLLLCGAFVFSAALTGCGKKSAEGFNSSHEISIVSREDGSGTRGAFIELFGIEVKDADGNKTDMTIDNANITNNTSVMMTTVAGDEYALGYISLGSLNDTVKAVKIDGAVPSVDHVKEGSYKIARPFNIVTKDGLSDVAQDFINYIMSTDGQAIVEENGYVPMDGAVNYTSNGASGKIVVAGSSSVTPLMEKLKEAYLAKVTGVEIEVQQSDSTTGASAAADGIADIGMCSREIKDSEKEAGLLPTTIAMDGIAVIVNNDNPTEELSSDDVNHVYTGEADSWDDLK